MSEPVNIKSKDRLETTSLDGEYEVESPEETMKLAIRLADSLKGGELILFKAPMGAGKTLFTKGVMEGLGFDKDEVTSPSFSLVNRYDARLTVYHLDLWRLEDNVDPAFAVGLPELLEEEDSVVIIEWAEKLDQTQLKDEFVVVEIEVTDEDKRKIGIRSQGAF